MPEVHSNLIMSGARMRNLLSPLNLDEPARKADIVSSDRIYKNSNISGAITIDWSLYDEVRFVITGDTTLTFTGAVDGQGCVMKIKQDANGNHSVAFPASVRHSIDMLSYSVTASPGAVDRLGFVYDSDDAKYDFVAAVRNLV